MRPTEKALARFVMATRWIQAPLYLGMGVASLLYVYKFFVVLFRLCSDFPALNEEHLMVGVLSLVDITLVANLLTMVTIGGYASFVSRAYFESQEDRPRWLTRIDFSILKTKTLGALASVTAVRLLEDFVHLEEVDPARLKWEIVLHFVFVLSMIGLVLANRWAKGREEA